MKSVQSCTLNANVSVLNLIIAKTRYSYYYCASLSGTHAPAPPPPHQKKNKTKQKTAKSANFSVTKEDDVHQYVVRNPLNKEGMKRRTIVHKIQYFVAPCALQHRYWHNTLKK